MPDSMLSTVSRWFNPLDLKPADVVLPDLALALAHTCRFSGHVERFYSVAQHSIAVSHLVAARGHDARTQLQALLHDAAEPYLLGDLPGPIKGQVLIDADMAQPLEDSVREVHLLELRAREIIHRALDCPAHDHSLDPVIHQADRDMLFLEFQALKPGARWAECGSIPEDAREVGLCCPKETTHGRIAEIFSDRLRWLRLVTVCGTT